MFVWQVLSAFAVALLFTAVFVIIFGPGGRLEHAAGFFVLVFLASWAGGLWVGPVNTEITGIYWIPYFIVGLVFGLMLAMVLSSRRQLRREVKNKIDIVLWLIIVILLALVATGYILPPEAVV